MNLTTLVVGLLMLIFGVGIGLMWAQQTLDEAQDCLNEALKHYEDIKRILRR